MAPHSQQIVRGGTVVQLCLANKSDSDSNVYQPSPYNGW